MVNDNPACGRFHNVYCKEVIACQYDTDLSNPRQCFADRKGYKLVISEKPVI